MNTVAPQGQAYILDLGSSEAAMDVDGVLDLDSLTFNSHTGPQLIVE